MMFFKQVQEITSKLIESLEGIFREKYLSGTNPHTHLTKSFGGNVRCDSLSHSIRLSRYKREIVKNLASPLQAVISKSVQRFRFPTAKFLRYCAKCH